MNKLITLLAFLGCGAETAEVPKIDIPKFHAECVFKDGTETSRDYIALTFDYRNKKEYSSCVVTFGEN